MPTSTEIDAGRDEIARRLQQLHKLHLAERGLQRPQTQNTESQNQTLSSLAVTILGMEGTIPSSQSTAQQDTQTTNVTNMTTTRSSRKPQSYFNSFQTTCTPSKDSPPSYATAARQKLATRRDVDVRKESLPGYTCTVSASARMLVNMESVNPLHRISQSEWRNVHVEVRGTLLNFYRVKDDKPSKLLRSYTLQHAEIGLAPDAFHTVLTPNSKLAQLIPSVARQKAFKKDPQLFRAEEQFILRLRVETDQLLLAHKSEDKVLEMIYQIGAGIDLAPAIDERSISKQCTVPRRRRRPNAPTNNDINNAAVIAEQERILQQMYPSFAEHSTEHTTPATGTDATTQAQAPLVPTITRDEEDIDLSAVREDFNEGNALTPTTTAASTSSHAVRPTYSRATTASSTQSTSQNIYETAPTNFGLDGKWQPPHSRTAAQVRRYVRRCAPLLTSDATRASDVLICNGKRMRINWFTESLEEWYLQPPSYKAHDFAKNQEEANTKGGIVTSATADAPESSAAIEQTTSNAPSSIFSESSSSTNDEVVPADEQQQQASGLATLDLTKTTTSGSELLAEKSNSASSTSPSPATRQKVREARGEERSGGVDVQGVVFCF